MDKSFVKYFSNEDDRWYHLRFDKHLSEEDMKLLLQDLDVKKYLYCQEKADPNDKHLTGKEHTHMVVLFKKERTASELNTILKKHVINDDSTSRSTSKVRTTCRRMCMYIVKDGHEVYSHGFSDKFIKLCQKMSFKKYNPKAFGDALEKIEIQYYESTEGNEVTSLRKLSEDYIDLKLEYNQNPSATNVKNYLQRHFLKKEKHHRNTFAFRCVAEVIDSVDL